jgi:hypothetical protein
MTTRDLEAGQKKKKQVLGASALLPHNMYKQTLVKTKCENTRI